MIGALFDLSGKLLLKISLRIGSKKGNEITRLIQDIVHRLALPHGLELIQAIGICIPGIANSKEGTVWAPHIPGWIDYPLETELNNSFGSSDISVCIASDRTCFILGEKWKGQAIGCDNAVFIAVSAGVGLGVLLDGHIIHGQGDIVGSLGWMALDTPFQQEYKDQGCLEYYASARGIAIQAQQVLQSQAPLYKESMLRHKALSTITSQDVFFAYMNNDPLAVKVLNKAIELWGMAAANVVSLFNPEKVIWGGSLFGPAQQFIGKIYEEAARWAQPISMQQVTFEKSLLSGDAGLMGAAYLALTSQEEQRAITK